MTKLIRNIINPFTLTLTLVSAFTGACDTDYTSESASVDGSDETVVTPAQLGLGDGWVLIEDGLWTHWTLPGSRCEGLRP